MRQRWVTDTFFAYLYIAHDVDGAIESKVMPHDETKMVMGVSQSRMLR